MLSHSKIRLPNVVCQAHGNRAVSAMWKDHCSQIFNVANNSDSSEMYRGMRKDRGSSNDRIPLVNCDEVLVAINGLYANKSPGLDGLSSEHLKFADRQLSIILSVLTTAIFSHGHIPEVMLKSAIVPIIKDKNKRINDKNNYSPICLSNLFTKVIEQILLKRLHPFLKTTETNMDSSLNMVMKCAYLCLRNLLDIIPYMVQMYMLLIWTPQRRSIELIIIRCFLSCVYLEYPNIPSPYYVTGIVIRRLCSMGKCAIRIILCHKWREAMGVLSPMLFNLYINALSISL